jgi:hypothetical protein
VLLVIWAARIGVISLFLLRGRRAVFLLASMTVTFFDRMVMAAGIISGFSYYTGFSYQMIHELFIPRKTIPR